MKQQIKQVILELPYAHYKLIQAVLERNPWLGYGTIEEFLEEVSRRKLQDLLHLEAIQSR